MWGEEENPNVKRCALCGRELRSDGSDSVMGSTGAYVCTYCLGTAKTLSLMHAPEKDPPIIPGIRPVLTPQQIVAELDRVIIGQDAAKRAMAAAFWKQQMRATGDHTVPRATLLLYGPTGCGKTALARETARIVGLPFLAFDATSLTETGYRGRDAQDIVKDLLGAFPQNYLAQYGIIFLDEVDKLAAQGSQDRATYARGTQYTLLKLVEGTDVKTGGQTIHTETLLFVFGGAFSGLRERVAKRSSRTERTIGFQSDWGQEEPVCPSEFRTEDFVAYGMEPELMGRVTQRVALEGLSRSDLKRVLLESETSVFRQYQAFFRNRGIRLELSEERADLLVDQALAMNSGARGLQTAVEAMMEPLLFRLAERDGLDEETWVLEGDAVIAHDYFNKVNKTLNDLRARCLGTDTPLSVLLPPNSRPWPKERRAEVIAWSILFPLTDEARPFAKQEEIQTALAWLYALALYLERECRPEDQTFANMIMLADLPLWKRMSMFDELEFQVLSEVTPPEMLRDLELAVVELLEARGLLKNHEDLLSKIKELVAP